MSEPRTRLDQAMTARSLELKKRWVKIAKETGITTSALSGIRRGDYKPSAHTARALEDALEWEHGSIQAVLDGGNPTPTAIRSTQDSAQGRDEITVEREPSIHEIAEMLEERIRWFEEDNARRRREEEERRQREEERIKRLEDEVRRLGGQTG